MQYIKAQITKSLIDKISSNNCVNNKSTYHLFLNPQGQIMCDAIIYTLQDNEMYILSNNIHLVINYINQYKLREDFTYTEARECYYTYNSDSNCIKDCRNENLKYWSFNKIEENHRDIFLKDKAKYTLLEIGEEIPFKAFPYQYNLYVNLKKGCFIGQEVCQHLSRNGARNFIIKSYKNYKGKGTILFQYKSYAIVKEKISFS